MTPLLELQPRKSALDPAIAARNANAFVGIARTNLAQRNRSAFVGRRVALTRRNSVSGDKARRAYR
jgi:hypothetical protein